MVYTPADGKRSAQGVDKKKKKKNNNNNKMSSDMRSVFLVQ